MVALMRPILCSIGLSDLDRVTNMLHDLYTRLPQASGLEASVIISAITLLLLIIFMLLKYYS